MTWLPQFDRRKILEAAAVASMGIFVKNLHAANPSKILLRSSWQTVNIGDIAHTPGMLALLEKLRPDASVTLWPSSVDRGVDELLRNRFPKLIIAKTQSEKLAALADCDFFLHGSGPGLVGRREVELARQAGKPYGFAGVTLSDEEIKNDRELMSQAKFVFCRDTDSMRALQASELTGPHIDFGPDATFAIDIQDDEAADKLLKSFSLEPGKFLCAVPRLRWTPYWEIHPERQAIPERIQVNQEHAERDHAKIREAISAWVRETKMKVLLTPEMTYAVPLLKTLLFDPLPSDVKPFVFYLDRYWLTAEAVSVYKRAAAVVSMEQHSPIMAIASGTPAVLVRQPTDTRKGQMWRDLKMNDWIFEIDESSGQQIAERVVSIGKDLPSARQYAADARRYAQERMASMIHAIPAI